MKRKTDHGGATRLDKAVQRSIEEISERYPSSRPKYVMIITDHTTLQPLDEPPTDGVRFVTFKAI